MHPLIVFPIIALVVGAVKVGSIVFDNLEASREQDQKNKEEKLLWLKSCKNQESIIELVLIDTTNHSREINTQIPPRFDIVNEDGKKLGTSIATHGINIVFDASKDGSAYAVKKWWIKNGSPTLSWEIHL